MWGFYLLYWRDTVFFGGEILSFWGGDTVFYWEILSPIVETLSADVGMLSVFSYWGDTVSYLGDAVSTILGETSRRIPPIVRRRASWYSGRGPS